MKLIYRNSPSRLAQSFVATVGTFDGVHRGHQYILGKLKDKAIKKNKPSLVISFDFPPEKALNSNRKFKGYLIDYKQKASLLGRLGIDYLWILSATKNLFKFSPAQFLTYINNYFPIDSIVAGDDFRFGIGAQAGPEELKKLSLSYKFSLKIIKRKKFAGVWVSSSLLRNLIKRSQFKKVKKLLGRDYLIKGKVIKGKGVGRQLGFPTANLDTFFYFLPPPGVYAACTKVGSKKFLSAVNISKRAFESHLINFSKNILGREVELIFLERMRSSLNFKSRAKLASHIQKDIKAIASKYSVPA